MGGTTWLPDGAPNQKFIRALDIQTGRTAWSYAQSGEARTFSGVLSTDGDVVFFGENSGSFAALDARSGEPVWQVPINQEWRASPMTYMVGGRSPSRPGSASGRSRCLDIQSGSPIGLTQPRGAFTGRRPGWSGS